MTAGATITVENMARWWGIDPIGRAEGEAEGLSAALWRFDARLPFEIAAQPDPSIHILSPILTGGVDCELFLDGRRRYRRPIEAGQFNLVRAGEQPRAVEYRADATFLHVYLPDAALRRFADGDGEGGGSIELLPVTVERDPVVDAIARALLAEMREGAAGRTSRLVVDGLTLQLAGHMVRRWSSHAGAGPEARSHPRGGLAPWQLRRVAEYLEDNLADDVSLATLARLAGLSPNHFCTAFRASFGEPPHRWLLRRRIERAKDLLADPRLSVTEIAFAVGFGSSAHFATAFRKQVGTTPSSYRREALA